MGNQSEEKLNKLGVVLESFQFVGSRADAEESGTVSPPNISESNQELVG
jgi:hypothetical protein